MTVFGRTILLLLVTGVCTSLTQVGVGQAAKEVEEASESASPLMRLRLKDSSYGVGYLAPSTEPGTLSWHNEGFQKPFQIELHAVRSITRINSGSAADPSSPNTEDADASNRSDRVETIGEPQPPRHQFEMRNGSMLVGQLRSIDANWIKLESALLGTLRVAREEVQSMADASYVPRVVYRSSFDDSLWQRMGRDDDWLIEAGVLIAQRQGVGIVGDVGLGRRCQIDVTLTWRGSPDFVFSIGTSPNNRVSPADEVPAAARLEIWDNRVALLRETDEAADIELLTELPPTSRRLDLTLYLDQAKGIVVACDDHGRVLAKMEVPGNRPQTRPAVHLVNHGPQLGLERFEVRQWDGELIVPDQASEVILKSETAKADSALSSDARQSDENAEQHAGQSRIVGFDREQKRLILESEDGDQWRLPLRQVRYAPLATDIDLNANSQKNPEDASNRPVPSPFDGLDPSSTRPPMGSSHDDRSESGGPASTSDSSDDSGESNSRRPQRGGAWCEVVLTDRSRVSGQWLASDQEQFRIRVPALAETLHIHPEDIVALFGSQHPFSTNLTAHKNGTLQTGNSQLAGFLLESPPVDADQPLHWQPHASRNASPIDPASRGSIIYRTPLPDLGVASSDPKSAPRSQDAAAKNGAGVQPNDHLPDVLNPQLNPRDADASDTEQSTVQLYSGEIAFVTGDSIDGQVQAIDSEGIRFTSSQTEAEKAGHSRVQYIVINRLESSRPLDEAALDRLLTVPRSQRDTPPKHLLISTTGDMLRGRLLRMDRRLAVVDVRGNRIELARDKVQRIIWLHSREWESRSAVNPTQDDVDAELAPDDAHRQLPFRVHVVDYEERGLTFQPERLKDARLAGTSELLGSCEVELRNTSRLLFGRDIAAQVRDFQQDPWKLHLAKAPKAFEDSQTH